MSSRTQAALVGGATIGILSALPIIGWANCCCLWILAGGLVAAYVQQQNQNAPLSPGDGALAGLVAGIIGAFIFVVLAAAFDLLFGAVYQRIAERALQGPQDLPPELQRIFERAADPESFGMRRLFLALNFLFMLFVGSLFSTVGGVIGAVVFRRELPPVSPPPPPAGGPVVPPIPPEI